MATDTRQLRPTRDDWPAFLLVALGAVVWWVLYQNLQPLADWLTYSLLGMDPESQAGHALNFFIYDVPKLLLLLGGMIFLITLVQTFISPERIRELVGRTREGVGNLLAALFGALTPFCSCSSVPLFIGFVQAGIPLGVTFSFLITSPLMNQVAFVLLLGLFGWQVALLYFLSGLTIGTLSGIVIGRLKLERYVEGFVYEVQAQRQQQIAEGPPTWTERFGQSLESTRDILRRVWLFVIIGIGIGAFIHGFVPEDALSEIMGRGAWWSVPASVLLGVPLYSNAAGVVPVISVLLDKGAALGTVLAFMMSVVALSLPELIILRRVLKPQLIAIFVAIVAAGIILTGYLFNLLA